MAHDAAEVTNLLYRYVELMDNGDLEGVAKRFAHARIKMGRSEELLSSEQVLEVWRRTVRLYPCGTPRTKHLITNPIVEIDEVAGTARCRSYYTVMQATDDFPLQAVAAGRYHDEFEWADGHCRLKYRDYSHLRCAGRFESAPALECDQHLCLNGPVRACLT